MNAHIRLDSEHSLSEIICATLKQHPEFTNSNFSVNIEGKELTLAGQVNNYYCKQLAQESIRSLIGELTIQNNIKVVVK